MTNPQTPQRIYFGEPGRVPVLRGLRWFADAGRVVAARPGVWLGAIVASGLFFAGLSFLATIGPVGRCLASFFQPWHWCYYQFCLLIGMEPRDALYRSFVHLFDPAYPTVFLPVFWLILCAGIALTAHRTRKKPALRARDILSGCALGRRSPLLLALGFLLMYPLGSVILFIATHYFNIWPGPASPYPRLGGGLFYTVPVAALPVLMALTFVFVVGVLHGAGIRSGLQRGCLALWKNRGAFLVCFLCLLPLGFGGHCGAFWGLVITFFIGKLVYSAFFLLLYPLLHTLVLFMIALLAHAAARDIFAETETAEAPP